MGAGSSTIDNVSFDVYEMAYNAATKRDGIAATPVATAYKGHFALIDMTPEGETQPGLDRERPIRYRLTVTGANNGRLKFLTTGSVVRIVKRKHPNTNAWVDIENLDMPDGAWYVIRSRNSIDAFGRAVSLGLVLK